MKLTELRKKLHIHPELSCREINTRRIISDFLQLFHPDQKLQLANGKALLFEFDSKVPGPHILYRADLDALPIEENRMTEYASQNPGVSHKCGHDGHMTLACSLPEIWKKLTLKKGKLGLLFQHGEEVAIGAKEIIQDPSFLKWKPDVILGLHNLPGYSPEEIVLSRDVFSCASLGLGLTITGLGSHAGEPEKGNSPFHAMKEIADFAQSLVTCEENESFFLSTLVHMKLGEENYGITPGEGRLCFTLRAKRTELLLNNKKDLIKKAEDLCREKGLTFSAQEFDFFPSTINDESLVTLMERSANKAGLKTHMRGFPFRWSEDFGFYNGICPTLFFGIGNGKESFPLHHPEYDFNDSTIIVFQNLMTRFFHLFHELPQKNL